MMKRIQRDLGYVFSILSKLCLCLG